MGIRVALHHHTRYRYSLPVMLDPHIIRLRPAPHTRTPILSYSLHIEPASHFINWQQDPYSNYLARLVFQKPTRELQVQVDLIADLTAINPFDFFVEPSATDYPFQYDAGLKRELAPYLETLPAGPKMKQLVAEHQSRKLRSVDFLVELNQSVFQRLRYLIRMEPGVQTPEETLTKGSGSCRDFAWVLVQLCRLLGLAARFVSGYSMQLVADELPVEGPVGVLQDVVDLHAWAEVYIPGAGWVGLDATCGLLTGEGYIPLAATADPQSAAPISGAFAWFGDHPGTEEFEFQVTMSRLEEASRVTRPYTTGQWQAIQSLGQQIDADLLDRDVRLTMGGEPTFVSIDDREAPEWNIAALGPKKRAQGLTLLKRLRDRFAPNGVFHIGQGKWYPGESLPRWAFTCYWRRDGEPIWRNADLLADEAVQYGFTTEDSERFLSQLAQRLGVDPGFLMPAYEDAWYYLWRERRLPGNVDPLRNRLDDPEERARLAKVFEQGLGSVVGQVLPLRKSTGAGTGTGTGSRWESGSWFLRKGHLFLLPGDSPIGFRLPLDSVLHEEPAAQQNQERRDPFAPCPPLLRPDEYLRGSGASPVPQNLSPGQAGEQADSSVVRTAICAEPRDGRVHLFLPPVRFIEHYLELVAAIESTAAELKMPVVLEGYKPPSDSRINSFSITPDPGVIEANMHPVHSWDELVHLTETLYEEAKQSRLSSEKFMLDGRHTGTGGGNHVVLGGPSAADSPLLRRPDLLRSLVSYWLNHPSLSYLFSGLFIGPTSQHPRMDEARHDALRELEIAFGQLPHAEEPAPPAWLVDRLFRNLLTDVTGNTHRTEFCIDKLFSPDTADGRRGLLELRSFEMPPHARMSCAQLLLIRGLISWFWQHPYERTLVRWGTALHDRFMLPHYVEQDFRDVLEELREQGGYAVDADWFAPHLEFRFPLLGKVIHRGVELELRTAIEPWHVLGEENAAGGAARYVDSSVERLQVLVRGLTDSRHLVTCNGRRVPLTPTGTNGEFVAGVRYRAWQPPSCLHPTIPVHAPLVFDMVDTWNARSIGGCTYHVSHPGGRANDDFPVNARAAESRRTARFFPFGHTPGTVFIPPAERHPEFPLTLDLRLAKPRSESR